jgi:hypothetical protein
MCWRPYGIDVASTVPEVVAELIGTEAYSMWVRLFGKRHQWG